MQGRLTCEPLRNQRTFTELSVNDGSLVQQSHWNSRDLSALLTSNSAVVMRWRQSLLSGFVFLLQTISTTLPISKDTVAKCWRENVKVFPSMIKKNKNLMLSHLTVAHSFLCSICNNARMQVSYDINLFTCLKKKKIQSWNKLFCVLCHDYLLWLPTVMYCR